MTTNETRTFEASPQQKQVFGFFEKGRGHAVVRARAGTGKTTTIIEALKYAWELTLGLKVLLAAFNKRIATELAGRITAAGVEVKTLHALGFAFVRRHWNNVRIDAQVDADRARAACGSEAPDDVVTDVRKLAALLKNCMPLGNEVSDVVELAREHDLEPDSEWEEEGWTLDKIARLALKTRDVAKERDPQGRIGFDDMIYIPLALRLVRPWYSLVVVDEAQDMNAAQLLLAQAACKKDGRIVVVGDDRQAIYGFRGADAGSLDRLKTELDATELPLTVTYRCGKTIVARAAAIVRDFTAAPSAPEGTVDFLSDESQLFEMAQPGDFVLCRRNAPLMTTCLGFLKKGVPARVEGRDVAAGLKAVVAKLKAKSVPDFIERVGSWLKKEVARASKIESEDARQSKIDRATDQAEALTALAEGCASVNEIFVRIETLFGDHGDHGPRQVVCSSVHRAKGLEADHVFYLVEDRQKRSGPTIEDANIEYVAVTRARLHFTTVPIKKRDEQAPASAAGKQGSRFSAPRAVSRHVGKVGQRETFTGVVVERVMENLSSGDWTMTLHIMRDSEGNALKWFSSREKLKEGQTYDIKATVKSHETYRGECQTILTRCAAVETAVASKNAS